MTVACVQQRMHLPLSQEDYREDLRRFMRIAATKRAHLVVFPELGGAMAIAPLLGDFRSRLLRRADRAHRRRPTLLDRFTGTIAERLAGMMGANFRRSIAGLLDVSADEAWSTYTALFGGLAREYGVTVVAPSAYLPDPFDGVIRNLACVFGVDGEVLGCQPKVVLHPEDVDIAQAGSTWDVIETQIGRVGLILGSDVLFPEVGRVLAYQGAEILATQGACTEPALYNKIRSGILARMQDNQLFAVASFLVGPNRISLGRNDPFVGKSAILAPQELTPRFNGVLVEMGNYRSEGVLAAEWDFVALRNLWDSSDTPVRQQLPVAQAGRILAQLYSSLQSLPRSAEMGRIPQTAETTTNTEPATQLQRTAMTLDDLAVISSVTSRWPPPIATSGSMAEDSMAELRDLDLEDVEPSGEETTEPDDGSSVNVWAAATSSEMHADDETDEMDVLPGSEADRKHDRADSL